MVRTDKTPTKSLVGVSLLAKAPDQQHRCRLTDRFRERRQGNCYAANVLENVDHSSRIWCNEAFAPVVVLQSFETFDEAIALANEPEYALQAGIFTNDLSTAMCAARRIEAGGVMINDSSDFRFDAMPFGGSKYGAWAGKGCGLRMRK